MLWETKNSPFEERPLKRLYLKNIKCALLQIVPKQIDSDLQNLEPNQFDF